MHDRDPAHDVSGRTLVPFFILTFAVAWGLLALLAAAPDPVTRVLGPPRATHPLFILAVWTPALVAVGFVVHATGRQGLRRYLSRLLLWRAPARWYALLVLGVPAVFFTGAAMAGTVSESMDYEGGAAILLSVAFMLILGPVEELGWRGLALPLLQRRMRPLWAGTVLGLVWSVWHLPAFFLGGTPQSGWDFLPFFLGTTAVSVILTGLFNAARGSILLAALFHFQLINPLWPDAQPYDMYLFAAVAVVLVWLGRSTMLDPAAGESAVVPGPGPRAGRAGTDSGRETVRSITSDHTDIGPARGAGAA